MTLMSEDDRAVFELEIYLPMILNILERDLKAIEISQIKIKQPYIQLIETTIKRVNRDIKNNRIYMKNNKMKVFKVESNENFTKYRFIYKGEESDHNYFNPRLKNRCEELLSEYLNHKS